jgi:hypothetical protein
MRAIGGAIGALLIMAVTAFAYFVAESGGEGSGANKLGGGKGTWLNYEVKFPEGLTPGEEVPIEITTFNPTSHATSIDSWSMSLSIDREHAEKGCEASWFEIYFKTEPGRKEWSEMLEKTRALPIEPEESVSISYYKEIPKEGKEEAWWGKWGVEYYLKFLEKPVNQSACEYATVTVSAESRS